MKQTASKSEEAALNINVAVPETMHEFVGGKMTASRPPSLTEVSAFVIGTPILDGVHINSISDEHASGLNASGDKVNRITTDTCTFPPRIPPISTETSTVITPLKMEARIRPAGGH